MARLRALGGILTGTWWLHQTMFPSGLCVVVGRLASRRGRLAARRGTMVLGIMGGMEPVGRLGARRGTIIVLGLMGGMEGGQTAARRGTIVLGIVGGMDPEGRLGDHFRRRFIETAGAG